MVAEKEPFEVYTVGMLIEEMALKCKATLEERRKVLEEMAKLSAKENIDKNIVKYMYEYWESVVDKQ